MLVPLGVCCIASAADAAGHDVTVLDLCFSDNPAAAVRESTAALRPDVVGLSVRNLDNCDYLSSRSYLPEAANIARACKEATDATLVIGGPAVSHAPRDLLDMMGADAAVVGEGEETFVRLLDALEYGQRLNTIPGVVTASGPDYPVDARCLLDPNTLCAPQPERWLDMRRYARYGAAMPVQTKRGCALNCSYCCYPALEGSAWRLRDPEDVARQVGRASEIGLGLVDFVDSVFGLPREHAIACCEAIACLDSHVPLSTLDLNPAALSCELAYAMNGAGFTAVGISAESASDDVLRCLGKNFNSRDLADAARISSKLSARRMWIFMLGAPNETEATVRETARFIERLPHSDLVIIGHGVRVLPRTDLHRRLVGEGEISPDDNLLRPIFYYSPHISPDRAMRIISDTSFPSSNIATLTDGGHPAAAMAQRFMTVLGVRPPYWRHLPAINRARRLLRI